MKAVVFGAREFGCTGLEELLALEVRVLLVVTYPREPGFPAGLRGMPEVARGNGIPVATPPDASGRPLLDWVRALRPDLIFSFHYDHFIPRTIRSAAPLGAFNLHESLLPRGRGPHPIPFAILEGEEESGVTLHEMTEEFDSGDIVGQVAYPVGPRETATGLHAKALAGARLLLRRTVPLLADGHCPREPQDRDEATLTPAAEPRRWVDRSASVERFDRTVRAFARPYAGARTPCGGETVIVLAGEPGEGAGGIPLALADGTYRVTRLAFEGEPAMDAGAFLDRYPGAEEALAIPLPPFAIRRLRRPRPRSAAADGEE